MAARKPELDKIFRSRLSSTYDGRSFRRCADCERDLYTEDVPFLVTKDYHYGEVTLEHAICQVCNEKHQHSWSEKSREKVSEIFRQARGVEEDWELVVDLDDEDGVLSRSHCWLTGDSVTPADAFQVVTLVQRDEGLIEPSTFLLSFEGMEKIQSSLSKSTRDERDRWKKKIYPPGPPSYQEDPWKELDLLALRS